MITKSRFFLRLFLTLLLLKTRVAFCAQEPIYADRPLSAWLSDLSHEKSEKVRNQAKEAVRQIGTNALPFLITELAALEKSNANDFDKPVVRERRFIVHAAFAALKSTASPAIPELVRIMNNGGNASCSAAYALIEIGREGVLPVSQVLSNGVLDIRLCIATIITDAGTNADVAIPALLRCLDNHSPQADKSAALRSSAAAALGGIGQNAEIVVPALIEKLQDENAGVRFNVARALGKFGKRAQAAVAELSRAKNDSDYHVRVTADLALKQIQKSP